MDTEFKPPGIKIHFAGKAWADLREDQKAYVQNCMLSWHAVDGTWYSRQILRKAIKKAKQNVP